MSAAHYNRRSSSIDCPPVSHQVGGLWKAFPEGVVVRIISFCGPAEIVALASLSQRLNATVTQHVLFACGLKIRPAGVDITVSRSFGSSSTFASFANESLVPRLLAISFWIKSVHYLYCQFNLPFQNVVRDLWHIAGFVSRLRGCRVDLLVLDFMLVDKGTLVKSDVERVDARRWEDATIRILEAVKSSRARDFRVHGGAGLPGDPSARERKEGATQQGTKQNTIDEDVTKGAADTRKHPLGHPRPDKHTTLFKHLLPSFGRKSKLTPTVAAKSPPPVVASEPPLHTLPTVSDVPFEVDLSSFQATSPPSILPPSVPNDVTLPINALQEREVLHLDCPFLLLAPHTQRTVQLIKSRAYNLIDLSLANHDLDSKTWKYVLDHIRLPFLDRFVIQSGRLVDTRGAAANDLVDFLKCHETITHLGIYGMEDVSVLVTLKAPLLPNLSHLCAHSSYVGLIVNSHTQVYLHNDNIGLQTGTSISTFPSPLRSITITAETSIWQTVASDRVSPPDRVVRALEAISHLPVSNSLQLTIEFSPSGGIVHKIWMERVIKEGKASVCSRLHQVRSFVLCCAYNASFSQQEIHETLPAFFNLFPGGIEVMCTGIGGCEGMGGRDIEKLWRYKCPGVREFEVTGAWRIGTPNSGIRVVNSGIGGTVDQGVDDELANQQVAA